MKYELFIAVGEAARSYSENFDVQDLEKAINESYGNSLFHKVFASEEEMRAFQDGLEFCSEEVGCNDFYVICEKDVENNRELIESLTF